MIKNAILIAVKLGNKEKGRQQIISEENTE